MVHIKFHIVRMSRCITEQDCIENELNGSPFFIWLTKKPRVNPIDFAMRFHHALAQWLWLDSFSVDYTGGMTTIIDATCRYEDGNNIYGMLTELSNSKNVVADEGIFSQKFKCAFGIESWDDVENTGFQTLAFYGRSMTREIKEKPAFSRLSLALRKYVKSCLNMKVHNKTK